MSTTQRYFDPQKRTRITVTTLMKKKKKKMQKQYAKNRIQDLMMMQMQLMLKMSLTQQKASQNFLTTPVDKWTQITQAKNELAAMGKGYEDAMKGIASLQKDLERIESGFTDEMTNWNDFMQSVTPIVRDAIPTPTDTEVADVGLDPISFGIDVAVGRDDLTRGEVLRELQKFGLDQTSSEYQTYFTIAGARRAEFRDTPYDEIFERISESLLVVD